MTSALVERGDDGAAAREARAAALAMAGMGISQVDAEAASVLKGIMCPGRVNSNAPLALSSHDLLDSLATVALLEPLGRALPRTRGSLAILNGRSEALRPRSISDSDTLLRKVDSSAREDAASGERSPACVSETGGCLSAVLPHMMAKYAGLYNKNGRIGIYTPEERRAILRRFHEKRLRRVWSKKIRYNCRKTLADKRIRVKGRFVKKEELKAMLADEDDTTSAAAESDASSDAGTGRKRGRARSGSSSSKARRVAASAKLAPGIDEDGPPTLELAPRVEVRDGIELPRTRFRRHSIAF